MTEPEPFPYQGPPRYEGPPPQMAATCYRHPDRPTGILCTRCGRPICPECMVPASVGFQCPECVREGRASVRPVRRGTALRSAGDRWGPMTLSLIGVNVAVFVVTAIDAVLHGANPLTNNQSPLFFRLAQVPLLVHAGEWWRVFTAGFLHFGVLHIGLNMLALLVFGAELERALGRWRFLAVYVVSLLGGAAALQLFSVPNAVAAGASTAIYGLLGSLGVLMIYRRQDNRGLLTLLAINVYISLLPGVSLVGHLGGLVAGAIATAAVVLTRRSALAQGAVLGVLGVALLVASLTVPTVLVLNI
jgi:membrane associated rhomboid family serine protease